MPSDLPPPDGRPDSQAGESNFTPPPPPRKKPPPRDDTPPERPAAPAQGPSLRGYEILGPLGRGGMGVVYKARHLALNRVVALKMIVTGAHAGEHELARFRAEAAAVARLQHPNVVQIFEVGEQDGLPYLALEFCAGGTLAERLAGAPLPAGEAAEVVETLARAMHVAHQAGIVHRDLKPANVLFQTRPAGADAVPVTASARTSSLVACVPKVTDFGLAKRLEDVGQTQTGAVLGTPSYMAPEQAPGRGDQIGPATDVYALGAVLYECLTGRPPFRAPTTMDTVLQVLGNEPVAPRRLQPTVPRDLDTICLKCLGKRPRERYGSAEDLADDLKRWRNGEPIRARRTGSLERALKLAKRRPLVTALLAAVLVTFVFGFAGVSWEYLVAAGERDRVVLANQQRDERRVEQLGTASPAEVRVILSDVNANREALLPQLRAQWADPQRTRQQRMRVGLALLPSDPETVKAPLSAWLLDVEDPRELLLAREALLPYKDDLIETLWQRAEDPQLAPETRFRALAALAGFDPDDDRWGPQVGLAAKQLVKANAMFLAAWTRALMPVREGLMDPLGAEFRDKGADKRQAASVLAVYAADRPEVLADLAADADVDQFNLLLPLLQDHRDVVVDLFRQELACVPPDEKAKDAEAKRDRLARRQANAALALLHLGLPDEVWPLFRHRPDPSVRTYLTLGAGPQGVAAPLLVERLRVEDDVSARRALVLSLGRYTKDQLPPADRDAAVQLLLGWYRSDPDPGIHGAVDWLLRPGKDGEQDRPYAWGQGPALDQADQELVRQARAALAAAKWPAPADRPRWLVNRQGQTLVVFPPAEFPMGSPENEEGRYGDLPRHTRQIDRRFALAARPVTVRQFQAFLAACPEVRHQYTEKFSPEPDGPIVNLTWYDAIQYCRWLSEQEGVTDGQMCYPTVAEIQKCKESGGRLLVTLPADYLARTGYRLPTEAEYEYACRAGASTSRYYGSSAELLEDHAWYTPNARFRAWPSGQKRPNDFGSFDMLGNVWTWCQEVPRPDLAEGKVVKDREEGQSMTSPACVMRGGSFDNPARDLRCGYRIVNPQTRRNVLSVSVRVARTCP